MTIYFILETVTREGMISVQDAPERSKNVVAMASDYGVTVGDWFYTTGSRDFIMRIEAADDDAVSVFTMALRRSGNVTVEVLKCRTPEAWAELVARI